MNQPNMNNYPNPNSPIDNQIQPDELYYPEVYNQQGSVADTKLILWLLDPTTDIENIRILLQGYSIQKKWDENSQSYVDIRKKVAEPIINQEGINNVMYLLNLHLGKYPSTSVIREKVLIEMTKQFGRDLTGHLMEKYKEYDLNFSMIMPLRNAIVRIVYLSLMRAKDGDFLYAMIKAYKENISTTYQPQVNTYKNSNPLAKFGNIMGWK